MGRKTVNDLLGLVEIFALVAAVASGLMNQYDVAASLIAFAIYLKLEAA